MQALDQTGSMAESAFRIFRFFVQVLIFFAAVATARWGIRTFLLNRGGRSNRWRNTFTALILLIIVGPGYRVYFGKDGERLVILLGGGTKKRQQHDISDALANWQDYKQRKKEGG